MNKNKKTLLVTSLVVVLFLSLMFVVKNLNKLEVTVGDKTINIIVLDKESKKVYDEKINTNSKLLGELLDEINASKETFVFDGTKDSEFGRFVTQIKLVETKEGEFWVYNSENNKICLAESFCPGVDTLAIEDTDIFTFEILLPANDE